ncbi:hypothetical protein AB0M20_37485 [Actinoplanes sp. NPDC051633]|uniref:hypothetical protein n=1 Tax=Actinoplanes sp. NPDC051633 TaxID=3155670 RepID=UPI003414EE1D
MRSWTTSADRLPCWRRVREFAVPPSMIDKATARREAGDWAGACAAARFDVDLDLSATPRDLAVDLRDDLRHLAPDLLRWHLPRIPPDGLLRPGLTAALARYPGGWQLVARTPPGWAGAGQRISLALARTSDRRYRLDLHRHLWDVRRAPELADRPGMTDRPDHERWLAEAEVLLRAEGRGRSRVRVRAGRRRLLLDVAARTVSEGFPAQAAVLPYAATWLPPDVELLRAGLIDAGGLHPLVAAALTPGSSSGVSSGVSSGAPAGAMIVDCHGARHRIALVDGGLVPLDHDPDEIRRETLLQTLGGPPMPCLRAIDHVVRRPDTLPAIRARLDHGDTAGALAAVERLIGPDALLRDGPLLDELTAAAERRVDHGMFRAGLAGRCPLGPRRAVLRGHPRHARTR